MDKHAQVLRDKGRSYYRKTYSIRLKSEMGLMSVVIMANGLG